MLKKHQRLTKQEFDEYFKSGKRYHSEYLTVIYTQCKSFHSAVVVGKKVYKNAVDRNRLRRQIYTIVFTLKRDLAPGVFIVLVKPAAKNTDRKELKKVVEGVFGQIKKAR